MHERWLKLQDANTERVTTNVNLPFGIEDNLALDVARIHKWLQVGGIRHLKISSDSGLSTSRIIPQISSVNLDGSASASGVVEQTVPQSSSDFEKDPFQQDTTIVWKDLSIKLNTNEITQRILESGESVKNSNAWSTRLNKEISQAVRNYGTKHLLSLDTTHMKIATSIAYALTLYVSMDLDTTTPHPPEPLNLLSRLVSLGISYSLYSSILSGFEKPGEGKRFSMFVGPQFDRALILQMNSRLWPAVKTIEK